MAIYLDCNSTTPIEPSVASLVMRFMEKDFGNAASPIHDYGLFARAAVEHARMQVAKLVDARPDEVLFTSGATESNNLAILGLVDVGQRSRRHHILTTAIEHKAVLEPFEVLSRRGFEVEYLSVGSDGRLCPEILASALRPETLLVSTMHVNNETGVLQPLDEVANILSGYEALWHVDASQGYGKELDLLRNQRIDMMSISGHKIYGPKGIGALIVRKREGHFPPLQPLVFGGGQEQGLRAGTLPVPLIVGLGEAAKLALQDYSHRREKCLAFRQKVVSALNLFDAEQNSDECWTLPHMINVSLPGIPSDLAINKLKNLIAISSTSACTSHTHTPSHVLIAMGKTPSQVESSLRFSWCHMTPDVDWDAVTKILRNIN